MASVKLQDAWKIIQLGLIPTEEGFRNAPSPNVGLLQLLNSQANRNASRVKLGDVQSIDRGDGKVYKVSRRFFPRLAAPEGEQSRVYCPTNGSKVKYKSDEVEIKYDHVSQVIEIDDAIVRCIQEGRMDYQNSFVNEVLRNYLNQLGQKVSTLVANEKVGTFVGGDVVHNLPLYRADGQSINPVGEYIMDVDRREAELNDNFILVGNSKLNAYRDYHALQTGNDQGVNAGLVDITTSIFYDTNLGAAFGDPNDVIAMAPGALQLITYAKHKGDFQYDFDDQMRTTIVDPYFGLEHDVIMHYEKCGEEIKMFMQFAIKWDVVGMPDCWSDDPDFDGVNDVFKYNVVCADTGICDVDQNEGQARNSGIADDEFCESAEECEQNCKSAFEFVSETYSRHTAASTLTDVVGIRLNGMDVDLGGEFDLTDATGSANFTAAAKEKVNFGSVFLVSGAFAGGTTTVNIFSDSFVTSIELISAASADQELTLNEGSYIHIYSTSTPSSDASLTDLAWTTGTAVSFNGAPAVAIPAATANYYGDYDNYFAETTEIGAYQLVITDDSGCTDTANETVAA
jgi:hypothetical protein